MDPQATWEELLCADMVVGVLVIVGACSVLMDFVKIRVFQRCGLRSD